jgi:hypothetical protein
MIAACLRREFGLYTPRFWIPFGVFLGAWLWWTSILIPPDAGNDLFGGNASKIWGSVFLFWLLMAASLIASGACVRSTRLDMVLPIPTRSVWLAHMVAALAPGGLILTIAAGFTMGLNAFLGRAPLLEPYMIRLLIYLAASLVLTLAVIQSPQPLLRKIPVGRGYVLLVIAALIGQLGLVIGLAALPLLWALVPPVIAMLLFARIYRRLSEPLSLVPLRPGRADASAGDSSAVSRSEARGDRGWIGSRWLLFTTILRAPVGAWGLIYFPVVFLHGMVLGIGVSTGDPDFDLYVPYFFFSWIVLSSWISVTISRLRVVLELPIPLRRVFAVIVFPAALAIIAGYGFGTVVHSPVDGDGTGIVFDHSGGGAPIQVPPEFWEFSRDGVLPVIDSPWGESVDPTGSCLFRGGRACVYNPFQIPPGSSTEFAALQLRRAIEAVCGESVTREEIVRCCIEAEGGGKVILKEEGFASLVERYDLDQQGTGRIFVLLSLLIGLAWMLFTALICHVLRGGAMGMGRSVGVASAIVLALVLGMGALLFDGLGLIHADAIGRVFLIHLRSVPGIVPGGMMTLCCAAILLLASAYVFAESRFKRIEIQCMPPKNSL